MSSQEILPGGIPSVGGPITFVGGTFEQIVASAAAIHWQLFARITLDLSTEYQSSRPWTQQFNTWEGRVLDWGTIERSVPVPAGPPEIENARIRLADTDRRLRNLFLEEAYRRRIVEIRFVERSEASILDTAPIFTGEIFDMRFGTGWVELDLRSRLLGWLDEDIPVSQIGPIINGHVESADGIGAIPLRRVNGTNRWLLACTEINSVTVYRSTPDTSAYALVPASEYAVTTSPLEGYGLTITQSFVEFGEGQPEGTEIRVDCDGITTRGAWGSMAGVSGLLRNPIDFFINMTAFLLTRHGLADFDSIFATQAIEDLRTRFESGDLAGNFCDGAIVNDQTAREWLAGYLPSFELVLHHKQTGSEAGLLTLSSLADADTSPPAIDESLIVLNSFREQAGHRIANDILYRFGMNYATGTWDVEAVWTNPEEQAIIGSTISTVRYPKVERETVDMPWVRDSATAASTINRRVAFQSVASYRQTFDLPLPEVRDVIDLGASLSLTHRLGLQYGGYMGREVKILRTTFHLAQKRATVETVTRVPLVPSIDGVIDRVRIWYEVAGTESKLQKYRVTPSGVIDGANIDFTLPESAIEESEKIYINGRYQLRGVDYAISGAAIAFLGPAPEVGDVIEVFYDVTGTGNLSRSWIIPTGAIDGINDDFVLPETPITDSERVFVNHRMMVKATGSPLVGDYIMSPANTIHFLNASPSAGTGTPQPATDDHPADKIYVFYDVAGTRTVHRYRETPVGPVNSINPLFIIEEALTQGTEEIYVNRILQLPTQDYSFMNSLYIETFHPANSVGILFTESPMRIA